MAAILQGNLGRAKIAQDLLQDFARQHQARVLLLIEPYRCVSGVRWYADSTGYAAIWVRDLGLLPVDDTRSDAEFTWIKKGGTTYVSVYLSPNDTLEVFEIKFGALEGALREIGGDMIVGGDHTNARGRTIMETAARLDLIILIRARR